MSGLQGPRRNELAVVKCVAAAMSAAPAKSSALAGDMRASTECGN
jgi:hypothetical protein